MNLTPLVSTFAIICLAELGDKTQLTTIALCSKHNPQIIFLTSMLAFSTIGGISIFFGSTLANLLPMLWIKLGSGTVFIATGLYTLLKNGEEKAESCGRVTFMTSFSLIALMELGDKTHLATIALSARYVSPLLVFAGMITAFLLITGLGVIIGTKIKELLPRSHIKTGSGILFIVFGIILFLNPTI